MPKSKNGRTWSPILRGCAGVVAPDGQLLATQDRQGTVHVYDLALGQRSLRIRPPAGYSDSGLGSVAWSPDSKHLAVASPLASQQDAIQIFDATTGVVVRELKAHAAMDLSRSTLLLWPQPDYLCAAVRCRRLQMIDSQSGGLLSERTYTVHSWAGTTSGKIYIIQNDRERIHRADCSDNSIAETGRWGAQLRSIAWQPQEGRSPSAPESSPHSSSVGRVGFGIVAELPRLAAGRRQANIGSVARWTPDGPQP